MRFLPHPLRLPALLISTAGSALIVSAPAAAQSAESPMAREIVQPLPSPDVERLNRALRQLARNSRNLSALVEAGNAALKLGDMDAAMGFFGRAQELSPSNAPAKMGMAAVFLRSDKPIDALRLFAEAEQAGASGNDVIAERGLAYDLVGNNVEAQRSYRAALSSKADSEITRRLALSQAIAGDREGFEKTLLPLLEERDFAAYRARAFGLAILGEVDEASAIADAVMPKDLSSRIAPYLAYMPRLTKAQQAAAANLGIFPRAAEIGRDDPRIAQYATSGAAAASRADARLAPQGAPLGRVASATTATQRAATDSSRRRPDRTGSRSRAAQGRERARPRETQVPAQSVVPSAVSSAVPAGQSRLASVAREQTELPPAAPRPTVSTFDLGTVPSSPAQPSVSEPVKETRSSVADAFAELGTPTRPVAQAAAGAVDIASIEVPREEPPKPRKAEPPKHPSRHWVQVATGRDVSALRFDWRRFTRKAPDQLADYKAHVTSWGQANRLLAGPIASPKEARDLVNALKQNGVDSFTYTSPAGEEITQIQ